MTIVTLTSQLDEECGERVPPVRLRMLALADQVYMVGETALLLDLQSSGCASKKGVHLSAGAAGVKAHGADLWAVLWRLLHRPGPCRHRHQLVRAAQKALTLLHLRGPKTTCHC